MNSIYLPIPDIEPQILFSEQSSKQHNNDNCLIICINHTNQSNSGMNGLMPVIDPVQNSRHKVGMKSRRNAIGKYSALSDKGRAFWHSYRKYECYSP